MITGLLIVLGIMVYAFLGFITLGVWELIDGDEPLGSPEDYPIVVLWPFIVLFGLGKSLCVIPLKLAKFLLNKDNYNFRIKIEKR